ncbi:MAG: polysaccharide biosynthesis tyrosine autokinase, partial [Bacteroidales bacterium]|nr:polysaccharide biosynthesis tyrosine autokinase [Bacteroidales bacterium]
MSNIQKKNSHNEQINLVDLFFYLLSHWYWFVICAGLALGYAWYKYSKSPLLYQGNVTVIIKDPSNSTRSVRMDNYSNIINTVSMSNEMLQLQSKSMMSEVVRSLDADVNYQVHEKLRDIELYRSSPVRIFFSREEGEDPGSFSIKVTPLDTKTLRLETAAGEVSTIALDDTVALGRGRVVFQPTATYNASAIGKEIRIQKLPVASAAAGFLSRLMIDQEQNVLSLSQQDFNIQRACDLLSTLIEKYNEDAIREKNRVAVNTAAFINDRLVIIQDELGAVEDNLAALKSSQRIMNVDEAASRYLNESRTYNAEIVQVETRISLAEYLRDYIQGSAGSYEMIPVNTGLNDSNADNAINQFNELILRREKLVAASSLSSPAVKQIEGNIASLRQNILGIVQNLLTSLNVQRQDLSNQENSSIQKFTAMPAKAKQMLNIERQQQIKEQLYIYLLNKREENALTQAMADNNARMVDAPEGSWAPVYPRRNRMLLLALLVGLLLPAVVLLLSLFLDTKIRSRKEIEELVSVPVLAEIPLDASAKKKKKRSHHSKKRKKKKAVEEEAESPIVYDPDSKGIFTEALRMMCTNLDFMKPEGVERPVVALTSFAVSAGKTFLTANIARCLADAKKRVILLDLDLRKRTISKAFGLKHKTTGLSNYLYSERVQLEDIIHKDVAEGVDFVPAGHIPPNPTELLSRKRFDELIDELKKDYDYILFDSVPVNVVADPMIISRVVDINLFVLRSGQLDRRIMPQLDELQESGRLKNLAIIFNGSELKRGLGYGAYGYGYGYGYG